MKLFVCDFSDRPDIADVAGWFETFGTVTAVRVAMGKKRRYAIVEMPRDKDAIAAIDGLHGKEINGQRARGERDKLRSRALVRPGAGNCSPALRQSWETQQRPEQWVNSSIRRKEVAKILVSNFGDGTTISQLADLCVMCCHVTAIRMLDGEYGPFALVEMGEWEPEKVIEQLRGQELNGRALKVKEAMG